MWRVSSMSRPPGIGPTYMEGLLMDESTGERALPEWVRRNQARHADAEALQRVDDELWQRAEPLDEL
jgi:hypothetical protein